MRLGAALLSLAVLLAAAGAQAAERILSYASDIEVQRDGGMRVTETIRVRSEGRKIRHGIYRDFPIDYEDRYGNDVHVGFEFLGASRDGASDGWHSERRGNGVRIYVGRSNAVIRPGEHSYRLTYETSRQLGYFPDHDELYWNVTGNGWDFPIDAAGASVHLPGAVAAQDVRTQAWTGAAGSTAQHYSAGVDADGTAHFAATRPLAPHEGLTIAVGWPKGLVHEPTASERLGWLLADNRSLIAAGLGLVLLSAYYGFAWARVGRDPEAGVIVPEYRPPEGYSPASMRYVREMGYDHRTFAAAIVNLAVKGHVEISEHDGEYTLRRTRSDADDLAPGEKALLRRLFRGEDTVILSQSNHATVRAALEAHEGSLARNYERLYFRHNLGWLIPGFLITGLTLLAAVVVIGDADRMAQGGFLLLWLSGWSAGVVFLLVAAWRAWRRARGGGGGMARAVFATLFAAPFVGGEIFGFTMLSQAMSWTMVAVLLAAVGLNLLFYHLMKAPTRVGRRLLDKVEGFREYMNLAEKDELALIRDPPARTPRLFEQYLPYALALGVEQRWAEKFSDVLARAGEAGARYRPAWYHGRGWNAFHAGDFTSSLGSSLSSAISSSSTAPGSSSGFGGGSSGGGGGGGGGGGW